MVAVTKRATTRVSDLALHDAARTGDLQWLDAVLESGLSANHRGDPPEGEGWTALHIASNRGHDAIVARLLSAGADPNSATGCSGRTPLELACRAQHRGCAELLVRGGAHPTDEAIHWAVRSENEALVEALLQAGASPEVVESARQRVAERTYTSDRASAILREMGIPDDL
jgi:ankyrin repeat protein